jgi:hypothetical protein
MGVLSISDHVMLVWQSCARNEWATAIPAALTAPDKQDSAAWDPGLFSLARLDAGAAERSLEQLRGMLADHLSGDGVLFDSRAWIVTARRFA